MIENLPKYYEEADLIAKQQILGSIMAEKLVFEKDKYRTMPFRKVVSLISRQGKGYREGEKKESPENSELSNVVPRTGFFSRW